MLARTALHRRAPAGGSAISSAVPSMPWGLGRHDRCGTAAAGDGLRRRQVTIQHAFVKALTGSEMSALVTQNLDSPHFCARHRIGWNHDRAHPGRQRSVTLLVRTEVSGDRGGQGGKEQFCADPVHQARIAQIDQ